MEKNYLEQQENLKQFKIIFSLVKYYQYQRDECSLMCGRGVNAFLKDFKIIVCPQEMKKIYKFFHLVKQECNFSFYIFFCVLAFVIQRAQTMEIISHIQVTMNNLTMVSYICSMFQRRNNIKFSIMPHHFTIKAKLNKTHYLRQYGEV